MKSNHTFFKELGLSSNEKKVLSVVTEIPGTLSHIERRSMLSHSSVFDVVNRLVRRNLIEYVRVGTKKLYTRKKVVIPLKQSVVTNTLEGRKQLISFFDILLTKSKKLRIQSYHGSDVIDGWLTLLSKQQIIERNKLIINTEIIVERYVPKNSYKKFFESFPKEWQQSMLGRTHITYFLPEEFFGSKVELLIIDQTAIIYESHLQKVTFFKDKETLLFFRKLFLLMSRIGQKVNSEEEFKKLAKQT